MLPLVDENQHFKTFDEYIECTAVPKGMEFTHTSLNGGRYYVRGSQIELFYKNYLQALKKGVNLYMTEKPRHIQPPTIDLDFRFNDTDDIKRRYTMEHIKTFVKAFYHELCKCVRLTGKEEFVILEKQSPCYDKEKCILKDGVHIIIPGVITTWMVLAECRRNTIEALIKTDWQKSIGFTNSIEDVVDEAVMRAKPNNWLMYGSGKPGNPLKYKVTHHWNVLYDDLPLLKDEEYVEFLSIRNKFMETPYINEEMEAYFNKIYNDWEDGENAKKTAYLAKQKERLAQPQEPLSSDEISDLDQAVMLLDPKRADKYDTWSKVVWAISGISRKSKEGLELAMKFSKQSNDFDERSVLELYVNEKDMGQISMGSVIKWLKDDGVYEQFKPIAKPKAGAAQHKMTIEQFLDADIDPFSKEGIQQIMKMTGCISSMADYDIAQALVILANRKIVTVTDCGKTSHYQFKEHRWEKLENDNVVRTMINTKMVKFAAAVNEEYARQIRELDEEDEDEMERLKKMCKKACDLMTKCKSSKFKTGVIKEFGALVEKSKKEFLDKLDEQPHLIGFNNGIYDLNESTFRDGRPEDFVTFSVGYDYSTEHDEEIYTTIMNFIKDIMPADTEEDIKKREENHEHSGKNELNMFHLMYTIALCLHGTNVREKFHIWTGRGGNGKGLFAVLLELVFGDYLYAPDVTLLTTKRKDSSSAQSELAKGRGKRFGLMTESDQKDSLQVDKAKKYTGNDRIQARDLYESVKEWKPQFTLFLQCNNMPNLSGSDGGIERRLEIVEFPWIFKAKPNKKKPNEKPFTFGPDKDMKKEFKKDGYAPQFMSMLIEFYKKYINGTNPQSYVPPDNVTAYTRAYLEEQDSVKNFIDEHCRQPKEGQNWLLKDCVTVSEMYAEYKRVNGADAIKKGKFNEAMKEAGFIIRRSGPERWENIKLEKNCDVEEDEEEEDEDYHEMMMRQAVRD